MQNSPDENDGVSNENEASKSDTYPMNVDAYYMGTDPTLDAAVAQGLMADSRNLVSEYDPSRWADGPTIVTGNEQGATPALYTDQNWSNSAAPGLSYLAQGTFYPGQRFPYAEPQVSDNYGTAAANVIDARVRQTLAQTAYGPLDHVGQQLAQNPYDPQTVHASNVSVDAAFDVMTTASAFVRQDSDLRSHDNRTRAERQRRKRKDGPSPDTGNSQASSSHKSKSKKR